MSYIDKDKELFDQHCSKHHDYIPLILSPKHRIIALGDLHGDFDLTIKMLKLANVINDNNHWIGKDTYVVQVGDQLDNCRPIEAHSQCPETNNKSTIPQDIKVFNFMTNLHKEAKQTNGAVISLIGNHELMNVSGDFNYVSKHDIDVFKPYMENKYIRLKFKSGQEARKQAFAPGNVFSKEMACSRICSLIIGDLLFVHAGFVLPFMKAAQINDQMDLYKVNYLLRKWLLGLGEDKMIRLLNGSSNSMFWDRDLGTIPSNTSYDEPVCKKNLDEVLKTFKISKMIIGHTPQFVMNQGINSTCSDALWRIDIGGSFSFDKHDSTYINTNKKTNLRNPQVLEILTDENNNHVFNILK